MQGIFFGQNSSNSKIIFILQKNTYLCITTLFSNSDYIASNEGMASEWWICKYFDENSSGLIQDTNAAFAWSDWGKTRKKPGLWAEILNQDLMNTKQEC
jgi:hypothetical protein